MTHDQTSPQTKTYLLIAGEASGDLHGAELITALRHNDHNAKFVFLGGDNMAKAAQTDPVVHIDSMAYMGFSEVLRHMPDIRRNMRVARQTIKNTRPDCVILIDYPSFNLKMAKFAKSLGISVYWFISPKVWAWKEWRVKTLKRVVDKMFVIFPFEVEYFRDRHNWAVEYVGNPSVSEIDRLVSEAPSHADFCHKHGLRERPLLALLPGSRRGEIRNNLAIMTAAAKQFVQYRPVIAGAPGIPADFYAKYTSLPIVYNDTIALLSNSRAALVTSGTATLEAALVGTPQVACYRANGSKLSYRIMKRLLKVSHVTLPNLIAGRTVIPEMLLHNCTAETVAAQLYALTPENSPARLAQLQGYADIRQILGTKNAAQNIADAIAGK